MQSHPELWSGWVRVPTPRPRFWAKHRHLSSQGTWPSGERVGAQGAGTTGEGCWGGLRLWASWLGDCHRGSGRYRASAECTFVIMNSLGWGGDRSRWPEQSEKRVGSWNCVLVLIHFAQRKGPHVALAHAYFAVDPWTTRGLGVPVLCLVKNLSVTYSQSSVSLVPSFPRWSCLSGFNPLWLVFCWRIYFWQKSTYKWTFTVQTWEVQGAVVFLSALWPYFLVHNTSAKSSQEGKVRLLWYTCLTANVEGRMRISFNEWKGKKRLRWKKVELYTSWGARIYSNIVKT